MNEQKKTSRRDNGLLVLRELVAGVDIASEEHWVAGPPKEDGSRNVRRFKTTSDELKALVDWLESQRVESVAMESTSVYWIPLYELLESRGIEAVLVNAREFHQVPGRAKTDMLDCQWLQRLHSCGMLRGSFRPAESFIGLRALERQRSNLVASRTRCLQWMQKSLDQMNVQVHHAVSDLSGTTGMAIVRAIVAGERSPDALAKLRDPRCSKSAAEIAKYLTGTWREEHLFNLARALSTFDHNSAEIAEYDVELARRMDALRLKELETVSMPRHPKPTKEKELRKHGGLAARERLWRATGKDLTRIDGISVDSARVIISELGLGAEAFPDERHFVSWLRLCPPTKISGGKSLKTRRNGLSANRISGVLRMAAKALAKSKSALGASFRSVSRNKGFDVAIFATARKLAMLVYRTLRFGHEYVDIGEKAFEARYEERRFAALQNQAKARGFALVPITSASTTG
jgi:transposase